MTADPRGRLVSMANQIAASVPDRSRSSEQTAAHLQAFWAPTMIDELASVARDQPDLLAPAVREAVTTLRPTEAAHG